jgi:hypothetical protein
MQQSTEANTSALRASTPPVVEDPRRGYELFKDCTLRFNTLRLTVHNTPIWKNVASSEEQVSMLLLLEDEGAIKITMHHNGTCTMGRLIWEQVSYKVLPGEKGHFDYALKTPVEIKTICHAIYYEWAFPMYMLTGEGKGSYYWKYV